MVAWSWILLTLISAIFFSFAEISQKRLLNKKVDSREIIFAQYFFMLFFVFLFFLDKIDFYSFLSYWYLYFLKAITLFSVSLVYLYLLKKYEISIVSPLWNLSPVFLLYFAYLFLGEVLNKYQLFGVAIIIFATYFLELHIHHHNKKISYVTYFLNFFKNRDILFIFLSFFMLSVISITAIADKMILNVVNIYTNMFFTAVFILFFSMIYQIYLGTYIKTFRNLFHSPNLLFVSFLSVISSFFILSAFSVPGALVSLIVPLKRVSTLFSSIFGGMFFHESHLFKKFFSVLVMIFGLVLISY